MGGLAIIVVTYNSADSIAYLLESVAAAFPGGEPEVVVVDNGSTDDTCDRVRGFPSVRLLVCENLGYAAGINRGISATPGAEAHLILNPDLVLLPGAIPPLLSELENPRVGIVAPRVLDASGRLQRSLRREPSIPRAMGLNFTGWPLFSEYVSEPSAYVRPGDVDWVLGAALLVARGCREQVGEWDESFFLYSEETDYCRRARAAGWRVRFTPDATVVHVGGGSGRNDRTHTMQIVNRVRYYARQHRPAAGWCYWSATVAAELSWIARGHPQSKASVRALLKPGSRPPELGCSKHVLPL